MNDAFLAKICDSAGEITPTIVVAPRGKRFDAGTLLSELEKAAPDLQWRIAGFDWFATAECPEGKDADEYIDRINKHFEEIDAWDDIEDPYVINYDD